MLMSHELCTNVTFSYILDIELSYWLKIYNRCQCTWAYIGNWLKMENVATTQWEHRTSKLEWSRHFELIKELYEMLNSFHCGKSTWASKKNRNSILHTSWFVWFDLVSCTEEKQKKRATNYRLTQPMRGRERLSSINTNHREQQQQRKTKVITVMYDETTTYLAKTVYRTSIANFSLWSNQAVKLAIMWFKCPRCR